MGPDVVTNKVMVMDTMGELWKNAVKGEQSDGPLKLDETNKFVGLSSFGWYRTGLWVFGTMIVSATFYAGYRLVGHFMGWNKVAKAEKPKTLQEVEAQTGQRIRDLKDANDKIQKSCEKSQSDFRMFYIAGTTLHVLIILAFVYALFFSKKKEEEYPAPVDGEDMV